MSGDAGRGQGSHDGVTESVIAQAVVLDVAYGRLEVSGRPGVRVGTLVESIDDDHVLLNGVRRRVPDAWATALADVLGPRPPEALTLAHPTTWGRRRTGVLVGAVNSVTASAVGDIDANRPRVIVAPRATLIAATHLEPSAQVCVVAECHDGRLDVHRMVRDDDGWHVRGTEILDVDPDVGVVDELVDDTVEAILVDGDNRDRVSAAIRLFEDATPTGRIAAVERVLLHRHGGAMPSAEPAPAPPDTTRGSRPTNRTLVIGTVAALVVIAAVVAGVVAFGGSDRSDGAPAATSVRADVGRVSMVVPVDWRRTSDAIDDRGAIPFTTFSSRSDDRRILVVQNAVRLDSTPTTVATSLRNRLRQSGSDSVSEFSAVTRYADRDVISYRETPGSGAAIRWYVTVDAALQVSVGCQPGTRGESIDAECAAAVGSVTIAPVR